ncbi:restriction endonuclease subunit S [Candidatus Nitrosopelagicus sp.]|nr:restriction endonuclease subunit S [Candidatus Nitrosopelagicus sp.]
MKSKLEWKKNTLGQNGVLKNGLNFNRTQEGNGIPIIKVKDFKDRMFAPKTGLDELNTNKIKISNDYILEEGDIIIVRSNGNRHLVGRSIFYDKQITPTTFSGFCIRFRANFQTVNPKFILYFLKSSICREQLSRFVSSTNIQSINQEMLSNLSLLLPSLKEQNKIVKTLDDLDNKIKNLQNQNHTLEQTAQAIFKSWFVDFDGVTEWDDSELGKIPKGWSVGTIGDFGEIITGKTPPTKNLEYYGKEYSFITIPDMHDKTWILKTERYLSEIAKKDFSKYFLPENSVLVSCIATVGLVSLNHHTALTNQQINSIVCSKNIPHTFVYCTMTRLTDQLMTWASGGSATPNLNKAHFSSISVLIPHSKVLENFHNITKNSFKKIQKNADNIIHLTKTRDTLLPKLMSGEIRV